MVGKVARGRGEALSPCSLMPPAIWPQVYSGKKPMPQPSLRPEHHVRRDHGGVGYPPEPMRILRNRPEERLAGKPVARGSVYFASQEPGLSAGDPQLMHDMT